MFGVQKVMSLWQLSNFFVCHNVFKLSAIVYMWERNKQNSIDKERYVLISLIYEPNVINVVRASVCRLGDLGSMLSHTKDFGSYK